MLELPFVAAFTLGCFEYPFYVVENMWTEPKTELCSIVDNSYTVSCEVSRRGWRTWPSLKRVQSGNDCIDEDIDIEVDRQCCSCPSHTPARRASTRFTRSLISSVEIPNSDDRFAPYICKSMRRWARSAVSIRSIAKRRNALLLPSLNTRYVGRWRGGRRLVALGVEESAVEALAACSTACRVAISSLLNNQLPHALWTRCETPLHGVEPQLRAPLGRILCFHRDNQSSVPAKTSHALAIDEPGSSVGNRATSCRHLQVTSPPAQEHCGRARQGSSPSG